MGYYATQEGFSQAVQAFKRSRLGSSQNRICETNNCEAIYRLLQLDGSTNLHRGTFWPTGTKMDQILVQYAKGKISTTCGVISQSDARLILEYLPIMTDGFRQKQNERNKRFTTRSRAAEAHGSTSLSSIILKPQFPMSFRLDASRSDIQILLDGIFATTFSFKTPLASENEHRFQFTHEPMTIPSDAIILVDQSNVTPKNNQKCFKRPPDTDSSGQGAIHNDASLITRWIKGKDF